jgi:phospho-N-acetylmuramoyl-pentapeptide-transferase
LGVPLHHGRFRLIGFLDDYDKVTKRSHKGVSGRTRLLAEFAVAGVGCYFILEGSAPISTCLSGRASGRSRLVLHHIRALVVVGAGNAVNLTDGLDGLATMPVIIASLAFLLIAYLVGNRCSPPTSAFRSCSGVGDLTVLCSAIVGAGLAFLWFNAPPAAVFMGDTGSLALGGALGAIAVATKFELVLPIIGGLFVLEAAVR